MREMVKLSQLEIKREVNLLIKVGADNAKPTKELWIDNQFGGISI